MLFWLSWLLLCFIFYFWVLLPKRNDQYRSFVIFRNMYTMAKAFRYLLLFVTCMVSYHENIAQNTKIQIACIGNSITFWVIWLPIQFNDHQWRCTSQQGRIQLYGEVGFWFYGEEKDCEIVLFSWTVFIFLQALPACFPLFLRLFCLGSARIDCLAGFSAVRWTRKDIDYHYVWV
jgi:hypothetical protein